MAEKSPNPLELLIRPNQTGNIRPNYYNGLKSARVDEATKNDNVVISWGASGDSIFTVDQPDFGFKVEDDKEEVRRKYDIVRVKNPDDPDQYVDTEVMTEWEGRSKISKERFVLRFGSPQATENTEIIQRGLERNS